MRTFKGIGDKPNVNKVDKKAFILAGKSYSKLRQSHFNNKLSLNYLQGYGTGYEQLWITCGIKF